MCWAQPVCRLMMMCACWLVVCRRPVCTCLMYSQNQQLAAMQQQASMMQQWQQQQHRYQVPGVFPQAGTAEAAVSSSPNACPVPCPPAHLRGPRNRKCSVVW